MRVGDRGSVKIDNVRCRNAHLHSFKREFPGFEAGPLGHSLFVPARHRKHHLTEILFQEGLKTLLFLPKNNKKKSPRLPKSAWCWEGGLHSRKRSTENIMFFGDFWKKNCVLESCKSTTIFCRLRITPHRFRDESLQRKGERISASLSYVSARFCSLPPLIPL